MKRYLPFFIVEGYLLVTLLLFLFGPIEFYIHNYSIFIALLFLYHLSFSLGYFVFSSLKMNEGLVIHSFNRKKFYFFFFLGIAGIVLTYSNLTLGSSLLPGDIVRDIISGVSSPGETYARRMEGLGASEGLAIRWLNIVSILFMFFKYLFIFYFIFYWNKLRAFHKILSIIYCFIFLAPGLAAGVNSINFYFFIFISSTILVVLYTHGYKKIGFVLLFCGLFSLIPIGFFGYLMSQRGGGFEYFLTLSPLGDISVSMATPSLDTFWGFYVYAFVWLISYLVQGYYGFSLALSETWNWTYGFGGSKFLQNNFYSVTGLDISGLTFQSRITDIWDENAQWHTFYSQIANDVGFVGVAFVMFILGALLARTWMSVLYKNSFYGAAFLPILAILFIFIPANNQIFGSIDTASYFFAALLLWLLEGKTYKVKSELSK